MLKAAVDVWKLATVGGVGGGIQSSGGRAECQPVSEFAALKEDGGSEKEIMQPVQSPRQLLNKSSLCVLSPADTPCPFVLHLPPGPAYWKPLEAL